MEELVKKAQKGDKEAFTNLILSLKDDLYKIAKVRLKNDADVYDVIQETMIIAFKSIKKLKKVESFKAWITKILINRSNSMYRNKSRNNIISLEDVENEKKYNISNSSSNDTIINFNLICEKLKYEDNLIMTLYYMQQFTDKEIGKILGIKENTVKTRRTRAKEKIKAILEKEEKSTWTN